MSGTTSVVRTSKNVDMSTKIGGRVFQPALPVVDSSPPSSTEVRFNASLGSYIAENIPLEPTEGIQRRERVLNRMGVLCREWIRSVCKKRALPEDVVESAGGQLFTSGSYRLGVHEPGADIDTILVAPNMCRRQDFFGEILEEAPEGGGPVVRDPNSLAERIRHHPDVTNFVPVEGAAVPILTFDWEGVNIDLLFARLNSNSVPDDFDIDNDAVLDGVDSATEKSLNGPRVTNLIAALISGSSERYKTFLTVVRCVRKWAKARGLYSNKMGYWGGVNINIAVALCVQLYPNATPANLLRRFFLVFKTWRWPNPVMLTKPHDAGYGLPVWNAQSVHNARQIAPIITPAYPAMNSTLSVSRQTLQIMHEEFCRGHDIVQKLWKQNEAAAAQGQDEAESPLNWKELFEPSDFFIAYPHYLTLCIVGPNQADAQAWAGFVESRMRKLVSDMLGRSLPLSKIQLWPKKLEVCIADRGALLTQAQRRNCITYFVGFQVDTLRMRGKQLNVELQLHNFREWELSRFQPLIPGMDVLAKTFKVKELPKICFEGMYEGGKIEAMKRRRKIRNEDPKRIEKKRLARLQELKAKMAEIQRRKEEQLQQKKEEEEAAQNEQEDTDGDNQRKRKREEDNEGNENNNDDNDDEPATSKIKVEENQSSADIVKPDEEEDLLESALDAIQDTGERKTREEAEADKRKLLAGELLVEGEEYESDDSDEDVGYAVGVEGMARHSIVKKSKLKKGQKAKKNMRCLPLGEEESEILRKLGCPIVSDDETQILDANILPPWKAPPVIKEEQEEITPAKSTDSKTKTAEPQKQQRPMKKIRSLKIKFLQKFDIVELDINGHVIDKGDEDFTPSTKWIGRKAGFEFKLGERGLGYYRTGKKVVVPSNNAY